MKRQIRFVLPVPVLLVSPACSVPAKECIEEENASLREQPGEEENTESGTRSGEPAGAEPVLGYSGAPTVQAVQTALDDAACSCRSVGAGILTRPLILGEIVESA